jgi:sugar lactone lactonase YvrE
MRVQMGLDFWRVKAKDGRRLNRCGRLGDPGLVLPRRNQQFTTTRFKNDNHTIRGITMIIDRGIRTAGHLVTLAAFVSGCLPLVSEAAQPGGPVYPPPLGVSFGESGSPGDGGIGLASGKTFYFSGTSLAAYEAVFWGATNGGVKLSFQNPNYTGAGEVMSLATYSVGNPSTVIWGGTTILNGFGTVNTRCRMVVNAFMTPAPAVGIPTSVGLVVPVSSPANTWQATMYMEVYDTAGYVSLNNWVPAYLFFNNSHMDINGGGAFSSFAGGFWYSNSPPQISTLPTTVQLAPGGTVGGLTFNINDLETPVTALSLAANSDNQAVLPNGQISVSGGSGSYALSLHTVPGIAGVAHVRVSVTDGDGATSNRVFSVISDTPPTVSFIPNRLIQMNTSTGPIAFTVGDAESAAGSLTVTASANNAVLVPGTNIVVGGSGASRTVTVTPASNQYGTTPITLLVSDGLMTNGPVFILTVNSPPSLTGNAPLSVNQGAAGTITPALLSASDVEDSPANLTFTVNPDGGGGPPRNGVLKKGATVLGSGYTFTMADVNNNQITYQNNGSCETNDDFQLGLTDSMGGVWSDSGHTTFSFHINISPVNIAPVPIDSAGSVPLGGTFNGTLTASNGDCRNTVLTYSIVTPPTKGNVNLLNPATGQFGYTASPGQTGADAFQFQVSNGPLSAASPGTVNLVIQNQAPTANSATFNTTQGTSANGILGASDPDLPPQTLTYTIVSNGVKGTATITNATTGGFVYAASATRYGFDSFTFKVNDGTTDSAPATVTVVIHPKGAIFGDLLFTEGALPSVRLMNVANGDVALISSGGNLSSPAFLVTEPGGGIVVVDQANGLLRLDPGTGTQTVLVPHAQLPSPAGIALEPSGSILVTDPQAGAIHRFATDGTLQTNIPVGSIMAPGGVAVAPNGQIFIGDVGFFAGHPEANKIVQIDPVTLQQTTLCSTGLLTSPVGIAVEASGNLLVCELGNNSLTRVSVPGGAQATLTSGGLLNSPVGVALDQNGAIYVASQAGGSITRVDPVTGTQTSVASGPVVGSPFGIVVAGQPVSPPLLSGPVWMGGQAVVGLKGYPGVNYSMLSATNALGPWDPLGVPVEQTPGVFSITDPGSTNGPFKLYRARYP